MNDMMSVIYITQTGHVIGAVTCNSDPTRTFTPADVAGGTTAGDGIVVTASPVAVPLNWTFLPEFIVPASVLSVSPPVAYAEAVFQAPGNFSVSGASTDTLNAVFATDWTVALHYNYLEIKPSATNTVPVDVLVWAQIQDPNPVSSPPDTFILSGKIPQGTSLPISFPLTIIPGNPAAGSVPTTRPYSIVVWISGYPPYFDQQIPVYP